MVAFSRTSRSSTNAYQQLFGFAVTILGAGVTLMLARSLSLILSGHAEFGQYFTNSAVAENLASSVVEKKIVFDTVPRSSKIFIPEVIPVPRTFHNIKQFTSKSHERFFINKAGVEIFPLLYYLTSTYCDNERPVIDIGTLYVSNALALAAGGCPVKTYDLPGNDEDRLEAFRDGAEQEWLNRVHDKGLNISFYIEDLSDEQDIRKVIGSTWLINLDGNPKDPDKFERVVFRKLQYAKYEGLLLVDDIYVDENMTKWWEDLQELSQKNTSNFRTFDLTHVGHHSGTGLIDFSGRVVVQPSTNDVFVRRARKKQ